MSNRGSAKFVNTSKLSKKQKIALGSVVAIGVAFTAGYGVYLKNEKQTELREKEIRQGAKKNAELELLSKGTAVVQSILASVVRGKTVKDILHTKTNVELDDWQVTRKSDNWGSNIEVTTDLPGVGKLSWYGSESGQVDPFKIKRVVPFNDQTKKLYLEGSPYTIMSELEEPFLPAWTEVPSELLSRLTKAGVSPDDVGSYDAPRSLSDNQLMRTLKLNWVPTGESSQIVMGQTVPRFDFTIFYNERSIEFDLTHIRSLKPFRSAVFEFLNYFGVGPWTELVDNAVELTKRGRPVSLGGLCIEKKECSAESVVDFSDFGIPWVGRAKVYSHWDNSGAISPEPCPLIITITRSQSFNPHNEFRASVTTTGNDK